MAQTLIEVRLAGQGMTPGLVRSKEIAEVVESVEDMIASYVASGNPEINKENIVVGLVNIGNDSIGLRFLPNLEEMTIPAAQAITNSVNSGDYSNLPSATLGALRRISAFTRRHECDAEFRTQNGEAALLAVMTPKTEIPTRHPVSGYTTIYGEITRVGGAEPKVQFRTIQGDLIYCTATRELARLAGSRLYMNVALHGQAEWNADSLKVESFTIETIGDYEEFSLTETFGELRQLIGEDVNSISDVSQFVTRLREDVPEG